MNNPTPITNITPYPDWLDAELWEEFKARRVEIKKPMTPRAERMALKKLKRYMDEGCDQFEMVSASVVAGWQDIHPKKRQTDTKIDVNDDVQLEKLCKRHGINTRGKNRWQLKAALDERMT